MNEPNPRSVASKYLQRTPTDSVSDITFNVTQEGTVFIVRATHPRLKTVGHLFLEPLNLDEWNPGDDSEYGTSFEASLQDFEWFRRWLKKPELKVYGVANTGVDRRFRGEAVGERQYLIAIALAATHGGVVVPNHVYGGVGATSADARRVWSKLLTKLPHRGNLVWGGDLNLGTLLNTPLKPRRGHGFGGVRELVEPIGED